MCGLACFGVSHAQQNGEILPIEKEPRHKLVLENQYLRVFDAAIAPGDISLYHKHEKDGVFVAISGSRTRAQEPGKEATERPPPEMGEVWFRDNAKTPLVHRVSNIGQSQYRVIDVEILSPPPAEPRELPPLRSDYKKILENERTRVSKLTLAAGAETETADMPRPRLLMVVRPSRAQVDATPNHTAWDPDPGDLLMAEKPGSQKIRNSGNAALEIVQIEIK
jgi:hypothetical protein